VLLRAAAAAAAVAAALAGATGCGDDDPATPDAAPCDVGDPTATPELQVITQVAGAIAPVTDGGTLPIVVPPQGGHILLVGVRVKNVSLCGATIGVALRDPCDNGVLGIERRPVAWRVADDGFAEPAQPMEISDYANVAVCPNGAGDRDIDGQPYQLEVRFYEAGGRVAERILATTPTCDAGDTYCTCDCDSDYDLGGDCPTDPDAGVIGCAPDAGP
jgi:hypothetical protein